MASVKGFMSEVIPQTGPDWLFRLTSVLSHGRNVDLVVDRDTAAKWRAALSTGLGVIKPDVSTRSTEFTSASSVAADVKRPSMAELLSVEVVGSTVERSGDAIVGMEVEVVLPGEQSASLEFDWWAVFMLFEDLDAACRDYK